MEVTLFCLSCSDNTHSSVESIYCIGFASLISVLQEKFDSGYHTFNIVHIQDVRVSSEPTLVSL